MSKIDVKIKLLRDGVELPKYATDGSAAIDLTNAGEELTLAPGERKLVPTGIAIAPESRDTVSLLFARSGLSSKHGICLANSVGVIDADYRGEICAALVNSSDKSYTIAKGERIAQLMFVPVLKANLILADSLDETERGAGGFGSTGKK